MALVHWELPPLNFNLWALGAAKSALFHRFKVPNFEPLRYLGLRMERLFETLGQPLCLQITERLLTGPQDTQENLRNELGADKRLMSDSIKCLISAKIVTREGARGPCFLLRPERVHELLQAAADLEDEITSEEAERSGRRSKALRKARMQSQGGWKGAKATS